MKKILIAGLVAFALVAVTGAASAWYVDIESQVWDANLDLQLSVAGEVSGEEEVYGIATNAGVHGDGIIDIWGSGQSEKMKVTVRTPGGHCARGDGYIYADTTMLVGGCLEGCPDDCDCPQYLYGASAGAEIDGNGIIKIETNVDADCTTDDHEQTLFAHGAGDFEAGMMVGYQIDDCDPVVHAMGATGKNVVFGAAGQTGFNEVYGDSHGGFIAVMGFCDPSCQVCNDDVCECVC